MTRGTTQIARLCAPLQALTCPMHSRSIHGRRLLGQYCSDLRLGRDGMKLQPAGFHQSRLSAGPPAVPSSSQPCMKLNGFYHRASSLSIRRLNFSCFSGLSRIAARVYKGVRTDGSSVRNRCIQRGELLFLVLLFDRITIQRSLLLNSFRSTEPQERQHLVHQLDDIILRDGNSETEKAVPPFPSYFPFKGDVFD